MISALLAIRKLEAAYVPLDTSFPPERLSYMISDSRMQLLLTESSLTKALPTVAIETIILDQIWDTLHTHTDRPNTPTADSGRAAYVRYTSGSTGKPKGVVVP